ncbi:MAG TPA: hypothetical protein VEP90_30805 [Methylomirabilota bacterium]|nr:hypothetical protein [Methylomirabilota bacterium]
MKAWKWLVFMWSTVLGLGIFQIVRDNPVGFVQFIRTPGGSQLLSLLITMPMMIWVFYYLKKMMGTGGKDPKKGWSEDKDEF